MTTPSHTSEHNGYFERRHRHIIEMGPTLLHEASIPHIFWLYPFATAIYLINRMPKVSLSLGSSFEKLFNKAPDPSKLPIFSCLCFPLLRPYFSHKPYPKSCPCVFLGYSHTHNAFLCYDPTLKKIFMPRHVKFVENVFSFVSLFNSTTLVIGTKFALPASSFTLYGYRAPPHPPPPPPPLPYPYRRPHPSSRRTASPLPILSTSLKLLRLSPSPHHPPADLHLPYPYRQPQPNCYAHHHHPTRPPVDLHPQPHPSYPELLDCWVRHLSHPHPVIFPLSWINSPSLCTRHPNTIGGRSNVYFVILMAGDPLVSGFLQTLF